MVIGKGLQISKTIGFILKSKLVQELEYIFEKFIIQL